jgi:hypothetical protein
LNIEILKAKFTKTQPFGLRNQIRVTNGRADELMNRPMNGGKFALPKLNGFDTF